MVVGYGPDYADLGAFLRTVAPPELVPSGGDADVAAPSALSAAALPPPPRCFGRDPIIDDLVQTLRARRAPPTPVLGPPGIGKSTVCLAALHHHRVAARFGDRRWFVRCNAATTGAGLLADVATALGVAPGPYRPAQTMAALATEPGVLVLDNVETPWEADTEGTEAVLGQLAAIAELRLLVTMRGAQRPFGVPWRESVLVPPLGVADGRRVFLAVAGLRFADDPHLDELVVAQDGVPLTIELLAYLAEAEPGLESLWRRWNDRRVALLRRGTGSSPQLSAEVSFELSIAGPRMTEPARRLISLLAVLPDGIAHEDLDVVLPGDGEEAAWTLRRVGLGFDEGQRLRTLQPIRDHVRHHHPSEPNDLARAAGHYRELAATLGPSVGGIGGGAAAARLATEAGNLEAALSYELDSDHPTPAVESTLSLANFLRLSGFGSTGMLEAALSAAQRTNDVRLRARLLSSLGNIALTRSDPAAAAARFKQARPLYEQAGDVQGQAECILGLGVVALRQSDPATAAARFEEAQPLYEQVGDVLGQANCIYRLGDAAQRQSDPATAAARFQQALRLYEQVGNLLGQANCIKGLGDVAADQSDDAIAATRYEQARPLYEQAGDVQGQANCIFRLGRVALRRSDDATAAARFEEAQPLYGRSGDVLGQANCLLSLGDVAFRRSDNMTAMASFEQALELVIRLPAPLSIGLAHRRLARLARSSGERERHIQAARDAWTSIGRADLVQELDEELGNG